MWICSFQINVWGKNVSALNSSSLGKFWQINQERDNLRVINVHNELKHKQNLMLFDVQRGVWTLLAMANPDLNCTLAFHGCLLGAKMGLMTLLTARQRMVKKVMWHKSSLMALVQMWSCDWRPLPTQRIRLDPDEGWDQSPSQTRMLSGSGGPTRMMSRTSPSSFSRPTFTWPPTPPLSLPPTWSGPSRACGLPTHLSMWTRWDVQSW